MRRYRLWLKLTLAAIVSPLCQSAEFFVDDIEQNLTADPRPIWSWPILEGSIDGMPFGEGDLYQRSTELRHTGRFGLKLDFLGRNGIGSLCITNGSVNATQLPAADNTTSLVSETDFTLPLTGLSGAPPAFVLNRRCGFERWQVKDVLGTTLTFTDNDGDGLADPVSPPINGIAPCGVFRTGDSVIVARECPASERKNDLNRLENFMNGATPSHFPPGESVFVRMYLQIPEGELRPENQPNLKVLRLNTPGSGGLFCNINGGNGTGPRDFRIGCFGGGLPFGERGPLTPGQWHYFEVEMKSATSAGAGDGEFRFWIGKDGVAVSQERPQFEATGLNYFGVAGSDFVRLGANAVLGGGTREGAFFYDDFAVGDVFHGQNVALRPMPPSGVVVD